MAAREGVPLLSEGEDVELRRRAHPCRNMTLLLVVSLLVNALCMSAIMTEHMEHHAEHVVAKTNQLRAVKMMAKHAVAPAASQPPGVAEPAVRMSAPSAATKERPMPLTDSKASLAHKKRGALTSVLSHPHLKRHHAAAAHTLRGEPSMFNIDEFRLTLLKRREEREAGKKPSMPLRHPSIHLRGLDENPNDEDQMVVDSKGAFYDPKLNVLVDAKLLGMRTHKKNEEAKELIAEQEAADVYLPQLAHLTTEDDEGHLIPVKENEAQQLSNGIFAWGFENPDTGDIRLDCTDTVANAASNGGRMSRFWGTEAEKVDACGPRDHCADECAYKPCSVGKTYTVECPGNCGHYGADVFGGFGRTANVFMDDSSICRAALSVGVGSVSRPFNVKIQIVEAEPAYEGRLHMSNGLTTFNYVWHKWDWAENPKYAVPYSSNVYACCSNPGAGAVPHLGEFTPTAEFRMRYDGVKWVNRVAFTILGGVTPEPDPCEVDNPPDDCECGTKYTENLPRCLPPGPIPGPCRVPAVCPEDGDDCCPADNVCEQPDPPATCPCGHKYTPKCLPDLVPIPCSTNMAIQFNGNPGDGAELDNSAPMQTKFYEKGFRAVTVEMWVKDNTMPLHRSVYFGGGEFSDSLGVEDELACVMSGFALGQWDGMLTFDIATAAGVEGAGCGVHVRSPDWAFGPHKGRWVHVAGTYDSVTGQTSLFVDGKIVHTDFEGSGPIVWPADTHPFVMGRHGDFIATISGDTGIDAELDEVRVWTEARSQAKLVAYMHKTMPDTGAFGPYPMDTVALYLRFDCQKNMAENQHRICSNAKAPVGLQLGTYHGPGGAGTDLVESLAPIELLVDPDAANCPAAPKVPGPWSWSTWTWMGAAPEAAIAEGTAPEAAIAEGTAPQAAMAESTASEAAIAEGTEGTSTAAWYNREGNPEDPWISVIDHGPAISAGMLVYGENSFDWASHTQVLQDHNGANVFVRKSASSTYKAPRATLKESKSLRKFKSAGSPLATSAPHHKLVTAAHRMLAKTSKQQHHASSPHSEAHTESATSSLIWDLPGKNTLKKKGMWLKKSRGKRFSKSD